MRTASYHPCTNGALERAHSEVSKLCRIYNCLPHELEDRWIRRSRLQKQMSVAVESVVLRYMPKLLRKGKGQQVWQPYEELKVINDADTIQARSSHGKITVLNSKDYRRIERPQLSDFEVNPELIMEAVDELGPVEEVIPLSQFEHLQQILESKKKRGVRRVLVLLPDWKESPQYKWLNSLPTEQMEFPVEEDSIFFHGVLPTGKLNFSCWAALIDLEDVTDFRALGGM